MASYSAPTVRPCERYCSKCESWKHYSRFRSWRDSRVRSNSGICFASLCKACEQIERNERKNADRPLSLLRQRTSSRASKLGVSFDFLWINMNWRALVPVFRSMLGPEGLCLSCGHVFVGERDVEIEHREPPRAADDWARQHARNLALSCQSCNSKKKDKPYAVWLDEEEDARLSNETHRRGTPTLALDEPLRLF
jgi:5-methylcytosine-specific restriction endonuclease McrA